MHYSPRRHAVRAERRGRARYVLSLLAVGVSFALVALTLATPRMPDAADAAPASQRHGHQTLELEAVLTSSVTRDGFAVSRIEP